MKETPQGFKACLFHPDLGNEVVEGTIFIHRYGFRFESGSCMEEIPADRILVECARDAEKIYFKDSERPELSIYTVDQGVFDVPSFPQLNEARTKIGDQRGRRELSRSVRITLCFLIGFMCVAWLFSWATGAMVRSMAAKVPPQWERDFGQANIKQLREKMSLDGYSNQVAQLTALAGPLLKVVPQGGIPVKFYIVDNPVPNAFALPGGFVVVHSGLLELTERPEELLGVLAHELAHVTQKHYAQKMISSSGPLVIFGVFLNSRNGLMNLLSTGSAVMIAQGFSREYETEADDVGWKYLLAANIDPRGMISVFRKLQGYEASQKIGLHLPQSFNSHPALDKRIARLEGKWKRLPPNSSFLQLTNPLPNVNAK